MTIGLNHSFVAAIVQGTPEEARAAFELVEHVRRRTRALPRVHPTIAMFETADGPLLSWAQRLAADPDRWPVVRLLLSTISGPFLPDETFDGQVTPPLDPLAEWLADTVRRLLAADAPARVLVGLVSPRPTGGADAPRFESAGRGISNWLEKDAFDGELALKSQGMSTLEVLLAAEAQMGGRLAVLPEARRSAERWDLDCAASDLHRALLGLEKFAAALGEKVSREEAAARYHAATTIPMSQESAATWKAPTRRRQRLFVAGPHGEQYFDMHAKPGNLTRVHVWVHADATREPTIYVGHCGEHLD